MACKLSKCVCTPLRDKNHYVRVPSPFSECNSNSQPSERVTLRVSHLPVKSHLPAQSLLHSSLGSQPFSTLHPYLSQRSPPGKAQTGCFRQLRLLVGCKLFIQRAQNILASNTLFDLFFFYYLFIFSVQASCPFSPLFPSALISFVINCTKMASLCLSVVRDRHKKY